MQPPRRITRWRRLVRRCRGRDDEAGAVLVLWVVALVGLMVFTAMAVDLGNIAQTKQHAETAVQDAVLAAVPELVPLFDGTTQTAAQITSAETSAANEAITYLTANYSSVAASDFASTACASLLPAAITVPGISDCFGFFAPDGGYPYAMAVAIPPRVVKYTFGRAAGLVHQDVSAVAYASLERSTGDSGGFPFSYTEGGSPGLQCLKTGSSTSCSGFTTGTGQFGMIDSPRYRIFPGNSTSMGNADTVIKTDMVLGFDHALNIAPVGSSQWCDSAVSTGSCANYNGESSQYWDSGNYVMPTTGQVANDLTEAVYTGGVATPSGGCTLQPLLSHPDSFLPSASCSSDNPYNANAACTSSTCPATPYLNNVSDIFGSVYPLNGRSIAYYLNSAGQSEASSCGSPPDPTTVPVDAESNGTYVWSAYDTCLSSVIYNLATQQATAQGITDSLLAEMPPSEQIFRASIEQSPRFGEVPIVASSSGGNPEQIVGFAGVYLDVAISKGNKVAAIVAWIFPQSMVENSSNSSSVGGSGYAGGSYVPFLCSYGVPPC